MWYVAGLVWAVSFKTLALAENRLTVCVQLKSMRATQARPVTVRPLPFTNCETSYERYSRRIAPLFNLLGLSQRRQAIQQRLHRCSARAEEAAGDLVGGGFAHFRKRLADGGDLVGEGFGPGGFFDLGGGADVEFGLRAFGGLAAFGVLVVGTEPADVAACLFLGAFFVQRDEAEEDVFVGKVHGPVIGLGHGGVDLVVQVLEDADQALVVNFAVLALDVFPGAELFQHIVHLGQGKLGVRGLLSLAVRVELFTQGAEVGAQIVGEFGEGEGIEAAGVSVYGIIADALHSSCGI